MKSIFTRSLLNIHRAHPGGAEACFEQSRTPENPEARQPVLPGSDADTKSILRATSSMVAVLGRDTRYVYANLSHERSLGYSPEELLGKSGFDLVHPEDRDRLLVLFTRGLAGEIDDIKPLTYRVIHKNGQVRYVQGSFDAVRDSLGNLEKIICVGDDITEKMAVETALAESEQRLRTIVDTTPTAIAEIDCSGRFQFVNHAYSRIFEYSPEELSAMSVSDLAVSPQEGERLLLLLEQLAAAQQPSLQWEGRNRTRSGRIVDVIVDWNYKTDDQGQVTGFMTAITDITDHKKTTAALRESEARFRSLVEYSADHVFMLNSDGEYLFSNDRLERFDFSRGEPLIGKKLETVYPPELAARFQRLVSHVFKHGNGTSFEHEVRKRGGLTVYLNTLYPIYKDGKQWAVGGISRDITTRKRYEQELQQKTRELERTVDELRHTQRRIIDQERQRALSQMASGIAHDFNNSLTSIQGFSDLLLQTPEKMSNPETVKEYTTLINNAARDAAQIVRRLRKFYRPGENERVEPVDLNVLIEEAVALTEPIWKSKAQARGAFISIEKQLDDQAAVNGNRTELHEVITNLIFNAVDAMPEGGIMRFTTRREDDRMVVEISDTGIGMDTTVLSQCLNPFYTTKGEAGSGLGLATVQGIITRHQGQIDIRSRPGRGTSFILRLPAATLGKQPAAPDKPVKQGPTSLRILIVDDEEHQRHLLKEYLKKDKHLTETAVNGVDAMRKFNDGWFDLVITDHAMPELNGDALARTIKKTAPGKPVIMLTGFGDMLNPEEETPAAVDLLISKPVSLKQLREAIRQVFPGNSDQ